MPAISISTVLQLVIAFGLLNVWILRGRSSTRYRGGSATSLVQEFEAYGLPVWLFYLVGALKIGSAGFLLAGLWIPSLIAPAAGMVVLLMLGAVVMHLRIKDPLIKSLPAVLMLLMSASLCALRLV